MAPLCFSSGLVSCILPTFVELIFMHHIGTVPKQINVACQLSLTFIAPSLMEKRKLIKTATSLTSGTAGLVAIIGGIGAAVGWGSGTIAAVIAWFTGASILGPVGWIVAGGTLTVIAGYFYFSSSNAKDAERFENALISGLEKAIDEIWPQYGDSLKSCGMFDNLPR